MASALIQAARTTDGSQPLHRRLLEKASQTFLAGVPVEVDSTGYLIEWDGTTYAAKLAGFSKEPGSSLTTAGVAKTLTYGSVPNQSGAVKIPRGAPLNDGRCGVDIAKDETVFHGQFVTGTAYAVTDLGLSYGLTKDSDNHWYVDKTKTLTSGGSSTSQAVVMIVGPDANDTRGCYFVVIAAAQQGIV